MGRAHTVLFNSAMRKKKKVQHVYLQFMSCQTESNMQQNPCFEHFGYQAHFQMICVLPGQAYRLGDGRVMYGWLTTTEEQPQICTYWLSEYN